MREHTAREHADATLLDVVVECAEVAGEQDVERQGQHVGSFFERGPRHSTLPALTLQARIFPSLLSPARNAVASPRVTVSKTGL